MSDQSLIPLSERLAQGPLPAAQALQHAVALAEALRRLHDQGSVMGVLEPSRIMLNGPAIELVPGAADTGVTPYSSPEQLLGNPPDARSDIFAYGAIVHEMITGRKAFEGATPDELRAAILERDPAPLPGEHAELAKVTAKCLAKAPLQRWQRMQRVHMELKMLTVFARRAGQDGGPKADRVQDLVHSRIADLEGRLAARIEAQDGKLRAAAETEQALRAEIAALEARLASRVEAAEGRGAGLEKQAAETEQALRAEIAALEARLASRVEAAEGRDAGMEKQAAESEQALRAELTGLEARLVSRLDASDGRGAGLEARIAGHDVRLAASDDGALAASARLASIERALKAYGSSIESLESAIAQTDDLVERVVEALDSLERSFGEQIEVKAVAGRN